MEKTRCFWARTPLSIAYHDAEWGVPLHDDTRLFEFLILEGAQAGLSWETILNKRENYRKAFSGFDPVQNRQIRQQKGPFTKERGRHNPKPPKIDSAISNAKAFLKLQREHGSF